MMGGQSNMGGAAAPTQATQATGMQPNIGQGMTGGGFDLSKLFAGNMPTNQPTGGMQLPQIMPPPRQPMPVMPQRTPMPMPQVQAPQGRSIQEIFRDGIIKQQSMSGLEHHLNRRSQGR